MKVFCGVLSLIVFISSINSSTNDKSHSGKGDAICKPTHTGDNKKTNSTSSNVQFVQKDANTARKTPIRAIRLPLGLTAIGQPHLSTQFNAK